MADNDNGRPQAPVAVDGEGADAPVAPKTGVPRTGKKPARGSGLALLALLIALLAAAASGYLGWWQWQELQRPDREAAALASVRAQVNRPIAALGQRLDHLSQSSTEHGQRRDRQLDQLDRRVTTLNSAIEALGRTDRDQWKLAEVEYLLRLANQRLQLGGELDSAQALLVSADSILHELGYADLIDVRRQLAHDLAAVRATPRVDRDGIYLAIAAAADQVGQLPFYGMPRVPQAATASTPAPAGWRARLAHAWHKSLATLRDLVVVRRHQVAVKPLLSDEQQRVVRARTSLLLEQAATALLRRDETVYRDGLERAQQQIERWFTHDDSATRSVLRELARLDGIDIAPAMPDISRSQHAIKAYIDALHQRRAPAAPQGGGSPS